MIACIMRRARHKGGLTRYRLPRKCSAYYGSKDALCSVRSMSVRRDKRIMDREEAECCQVSHTSGLPLLKAAPKSLPKAMRAPMVGRLQAK